MRKIQWNNIVVIFVIICISLVFAEGIIKGIISKVQTTDDTNNVHYIEVHDGDSVVIYKNHYKDDK